jgi:hypothetical protein
MRRQRVLERVGWRFWRCFASSYYRDPDGVLNDLVEMLTRMGIEPFGKGETGRSAGRFTEHRTIGPPPIRAEEFNPGAADLGAALEEAAAEVAGSVAAGIGIGDKVVLVFSDDHKRMSVRLFESGTDPEKGRVAIGSPLGKAIFGAEEGDEVELHLENGQQRKLLIESVEKSQLTEPLGLSHPVLRTAAVA